MPERFQRYSALSQELAKAAADKNYAKMIDLCQQQVALVGESGFDGGRTNYNLARVLARVGRKDDALKALNLAIDQGFDNVNRIKEDKNLKSLRDDKRFDEATQKAAHARQADAAGRTVGGQIGQQVSQRASRRKRSMARWAWGWAKGRRSWPSCRVPAQRRPV